MRVLITGANRGIGAALTDAYRARKDDVIGTSRHKVDGLEELDVTRPESHQQLAHRLDARPIDFLICNAGVYHDRGQTLDTGYGAELWAETFGANVTGVFLTIQNLLPNLQSAESPRIAIISSAMGSSARAPGGSYIYRASKAAALNLGRNLSQDLRAQGIAVGIYHPGWVRTDMGGNEADISLEQSVEGLLARFDQLTLATSGEFLTYDGNEIAF